jgi:hypothetical protein
MARSHEGSSAMYYVMLLPAILSGAALCLMVGVSVWERVSEWRARQAAVPKLLGSEAAPIVINAVQIGSAD